MAKVVPLKLTADQALRMVRQLAKDSDRIVVVDHAKKRQKSRRYTRRQIELCLQKGTIVEGPFLNAKGNWQVNMYRHAAGEEMTCVVAIEWSVKLIVVTVI